MFWLIASTFLVAAGVYLAWPLLARGSAWKGIGLAVALLMPIAGLILYQDVGTPSALDIPAAAPAPDMNELVDRLKERLTEREEDLEGWLLLGRSLKSLQRFEESVNALETAERIEPGNPLIQVELAEARLYASGNPQITPDIRQALLNAVEKDPTLQKGLWLLGIDAVQQGDDAGAIEYWERLLDLVEPDNPVAQTVSEQLGLARQRLGEPTASVQPTAPAPAPAPAPASDIGQAWPGFQVDVSLGDGANTNLPPSAVLFVIVRLPGQSAGPPLGVARVDQPEFPVSLTIDDGNSMIRSRSLSGFESFSIQARLSLSGRVTASAGDHESAPVEVARDSGEPIAISLDRIVQ